MIFPSKETLIRALQRAGWAAGVGALSAFTTVPVVLDDPKIYLVVLAAAMLTGALMGLQKVISGYVKYDRLDK